MVKTAHEIIQKRKELWQTYHDIEKDKEYTQAIADYMLKDEAKPLRKEISDNPEYLIEMAFVVVDKEMNTVPFFLNGIQKSFIQDLKQAKTDFLEGKRIHLNFLILKGRQGGFTSVITAYQLACSITQRNFSGFTLADSSDNTNTIFEDKAKFPYSNLPEQLKPTEKYNNRREFHFEKLNSRWRVNTAGNKEVGRSKTINFFHGSETAFWDGLTKILTGLGEALTKDSIKILETTANGYNEYKDLWDDATSGENTWEAKFYPWWLTPEYRQKFESEQIKNEFTQDISNREEWIHKRCKWLRDFVKIEPEQIYWYFNKWKDLKENIKQEYPCSADEAFLASGRCVFDQEIIIQRKEFLKRYYKDNPPKRGYFIFEWNNPETKDKIKDETIRFIEHSEGYIWIYEDAKPYFPYVLGGDTKGEGSDFFAGTVINNVTGKRSAVLHGNLDPDTYAHQMYCLGRHYNTALISIEINFDIYPVKELERLGYGNQYKREIVDSISDKKQEKHGWKTDGNTRPMIISNQITVIRDTPESFTHIQMLDEGLTFVYDKENRPDAESGKHDDLLFSDMIAENSRDQQSRRVREPKKPTKSKVSSVTGY